MQTSHLKLNVATLLEKCTFGQLKQIHALIITTRLCQDSDILLKFLRRSTEFGGMDYSGVIFSHILNDSAPSSTQVSLWNAMIRGYSYNGPSKFCFSVYDEMQRRGLKPNNFTYPYILDCCSHLGGYAMGQRVHCQVIKSGFGCASRVSESLLNMYVKLPEISDSAQVVVSESFGCACKVFDEMCFRPVESWNRMIRHYANAGDVESAWRLFKKMPHRDIISWNSMVSCFSKAGDVARARQLFEVMPEKNVVSWTLMVGAFGKSGDLEIARDLFETMPEKNVFSWNTMISCYTQHGKFQLALDLFVKMLSNGIDPDGFSFASALIACSHLGAIEFGKWIRFQIRDWSNFTVIIGTALIEMYAKCGDVAMAFSIFLKIGENKDVFCWNVMINSLAIHGRAQDAVKLFFLMKRVGLKPNNFTFLSTLFACSHGGLVDEGQRIFYSMETDFGVCPTLEHYGCLIDLLCRNGQLKKAVHMVEKMPFSPDIAIWGALLGGCRMQDEVKLAEEVMTKINALKVNEPGFFASMSNLYASKEQWPKALSAREEMEEKQLWKEVGYSSVI